jgi:hypothetical protein
MQTASVGLAVIPKKNLAHAGRIRMLCMYDLAVNPGANSGQSNQNSCFFVATISCERHFLIRLIEICGYKNDAG